MKKIIKILKSALALALCTVMIITSTSIVNATELSQNSIEEWNLLIQAEDVKEINSIEELDVSNAMLIDNKDFSACRLIIYSSENMEFKDNIFEDKIKSVQHMEDFYIVEYSTPEITEDVYNLYTSMGYEVEIDIINDTPEEVIDTDDRDNEVEIEKIALTNADKDAETIDNADDDTVIVAVLDTGLNAGEDIFSDRLIDGEDFITAYDNEEHNTYDNNGHGTAMARIVLDTVDNNSNNIKIMPIKVLNDNGKGTTLSVYKGIKYAIEKNVDVINLSMSGIGHSKLLESAINEAYNNNIPVVVSAGNDNKEIMDYAPANINSAITISSTDVEINEEESIYTKAKYSNYGTNDTPIDFTTSGYYEYKRIINDTEVTTSADGTSVSAAYVTSYIAMLKQLALADESDDNLTFNDYYESLKISAISLDNKFYFGHGYLEKSNIKLSRQDKEQELLSVEEIEETDEGITLTQDYTVANLNLDSTDRTKSFQMGSSGDISNKMWIVVNPSANAGWWLKTDKNNAYIESGDFSGGIGGTNATFTTVMNNVKSAFLWAGLADFGDFTCHVNIRVDGNANFDTYFETSKDMYLKGGTYNNHTGYSSVNRSSWTGKRTCSQAYGVMFKPKGNFRTHNCVFDGCNAFQDPFSFGANAIYYDAEYMKYTSYTDTFKHGYSGSVYVGQYAYLDVQNSTFQDSWNAITTSGSGNQGVSVSDSTFNNIECDAITIYGGSVNNEIKNCTFNSVNCTTDTQTLTYNGITIHPDSQAIKLLRATATISGCSFKNINATGVRVMNNATATISNCDIDGAGYNYGIYTYSGGTTTFNGTRIIKYKYGIVNYGQVEMKGGSVGLNGSGMETGVINNSGATFTQSGGSVGYNWSGVENGGTYTLSSSGTINNNIGHGINNSGSFTMSGGRISSNGGYGVYNSNTVRHSGGGIYSNNGTKPDSSDSDFGGVYQNGTYYISGSAGVYNNSIYLPNCRVVNQSGGFTGSASLTTNTNDRTVGRELVQQSGASYEGKYSLAYGDVWGYSKVASMKNDDVTSFTGKQGIIRAGSNIKKSGITSTTLYLSGEYEIKYDPNTPSEVDRSDITPNPDFESTEFKWREATTALLSQRYTDTTQTFEQTGWQDAVGSTLYINNQTFDEISNVLNKTKTYYAQWDMVAEKYYIYYNINNGYGDNETRTYRIGNTYNYPMYADDFPKLQPSRYVSATITFDTNGGDDIATVSGLNPVSAVSVNEFKVIKNFNGWNKAGESTLRVPGNTFKNLGSNDETVTLNGKWTPNGFYLPDCEKDEAELVGWQDPAGTILPAGTFIPITTDDPVIYIAVWGDMDRTIIYNPNGAVNTSGVALGNIKDKENAPKLASTPITLLNGDNEGVGGKLLTEDITYSQGYVNYDLEKYVPEYATYNTQQYKAKKGDIVNNLGSKFTLAKFMGWTKEPDTGEAFNGEVTLTDDRLWGNKAKRMNDFTFYAYWDYFPALTATTLEIDNIGDITTALLLEGVTSLDAEDGDISDKIQLINYNEVVNAFNKASEQFTAIYEVTDSVGNTTRAFRIIKLKDDYDGKALPVITKLVRTIDRHAYNTRDASLGGCLNDSIWYNDASYIAVMNSGFDNMDNNTPIAHYMLTKAERVEISEHMHEVGIEHMHDKEVLQYYVDNYMDEEHSSRTHTYQDFKVGFITISAETMQKRDQQELDRLKALRNDMDLSRIYR